MLLMEEAERIALEEHGSNKIAVISGTIFTISGSVGACGVFSMWFVCFCLVELYV